MNLPSQFSPRPSAGLAESDAATIARSGYAYSYTADLQELVSTRLSSVLRSLERMKPPVTSLKVPSAAPAGTLAPSPLAKTPSFANLVDARPDLSRASSALLKAPKINSYIAAIEGAFNLDTSAVQPKSHAVPIFSFREEANWSKSLAKFSAEAGADTGDLLEIMSMPYIDVSTRRGRPALLRRTSSFATIPIVEQTLNQPDATCEPTPVAASTNKHSARNAVFTTTTSHPYCIRSFNDYACLMFGIQEHTVGASMLGFIDTTSHKFVLDALNTQSEIPLSGALVDIVKQDMHSIASFWVERSGNFFVWIVEEIDMRIEQFPIAGPCPFEGVDIESLSPDIAQAPQHTLHHATVALDGRLSPLLWSHDGTHIKIRCPPIIGTALVLDSTNRILAYNYSSLYHLLGIDPGTLKGLAVDSIIPHFQSYLESIRRLTNLQVTPGVVVPEHMFRRVACKDPGTYFDDYPRAGVHALSSRGKEIPVDIELRIVSPQLHVLWITFNRPPFKSNAACMIPSQLELLNTSRATSEHSDSTTSSPATPRVRSSSISSVSPSPVSTPALSRQPTQTAAPAPLTPVKIGAKRRELTMGDFSIIRTLGEGSYGKVMVATANGDPDHPIIIKSIFKDRILVDTWTRDRGLGTIPNEIKILYQLCEHPHPNIIKLIDFFEDTKNYHVITRLHGNPAVDLFDYIEQHPDVSIDTCKSIFTMVVSAVAHLHSLGIVHRDIKDENIIVDENGICQLIDFGSAAYTRKGPFDVFVGTVDFAAPEVLEGNPFQGPPQDVWALGVLLYTILYKENPFSNVDEILAAELDIPQDLDPDCTKILHAVLVREVKQRPTVQWVLEQLESESS